MKIGILTFHDGINHGGFFQAYSTFSLLRSWGHDVEIINYKNSTHWFKEYKAFLFT
ncbi:MAG: polysaccharide pyruvyl transferase family protein, partial [Deltaproteobacteria bacterium]|nr:polysaccharide pyruvyl transferase family protein [Deltaproteobacteria bacterium]